MLTDDKTCRATSVQGQESQETSVSRFDRLTPIPVQTAITLASAGTLIFALIVVEVLGEDASIRFGDLMQFAGRMAGIAGLSDLLVAAMLTLAEQELSLARDLATCGFAFLLIALPLSFRVLAC